MKHLKELPEILAADFERKWNAFCIESEKADISLPDNPEFLKTLKLVFVFSDFVAVSCTRNPEMLTGLIESGDLKQRYSPDTYNTKIKTSLAEAKDDNTLEQILRRIRTREMVRIAWRDLTGLADLAETMSDLSAFADACIDHTLSILYDRQCTEFGIPTGSDNLPLRLIVIGMGKLGGHELNFSSDVDLIFAFAEQGKTKQGPKSISNEEFFLRLCRQIIRIIGRATSDGFVFRVDTRLRPFGENGPLCMSFDAMEQYYQRQGREWERYAWIKARVVAGDKEAGKQLLEKLNPFIYRRYLDFGVFGSLRDMKKKISLEIKRKGMKENIKLGPGGIREIEFFGQVFQLIRGGVVPALQERRIEKVLRILAEESYFPQNVCDELLQAYEFLRKTEHRLQEFYDQQTHKLPSDPVDRERLAASMGFDSYKIFCEHLEKHTKNVHVHFMALLETRESKEKNEIASDELDNIWLGLTDDEHSGQNLLNAGYKRPEEVIRLLDHLRNDLATRALSTEGRRRLDKLVPLVLKEISTVEQPDITLNRIVDLIKTIERRTSYLALLIENPSALTHLVKLSCASPLITSLLAAHPVLLDELLDTRTLYVPPAKDELNAQLKKKLEQVSTHELEYQIEQLCIFKQANTLHVAAADVTGSLPLMRVSDHLSYIAETVLNEVVDLAWNHLVEKHGTPTCLLNGKKCDRGFVVIAYGKLGGIELGYGSDLDLVFLHAGSGGQATGGIQPIDNAQFFARLGQRVVHILTAHTRAGNLYEIDMRLRPSGSSGILVSQIEAFSEYQHKSAWTWEHQALIRARAICGDIHLIEHFNNVRKEVLLIPKDKTRLRGEVSDMRERLRKERLKPKPGIFDIKQDRGGIVDIEFLVQYLVLLNSNKYPELLKFTDNVRQVQSLTETKVIDEYTANLLRHAYLIFRAVAHKFSLQEKHAEVPEDKFYRLREKITKIWKVFMEKK
ncbi:MAG: bifunctional [glutamate--ammonia ligase]-adenylyl-L-tyrosine phosphorylase/[glutamate--ammonia-ligase] adenylyltransferase [Desulfobacterales bacterium]|nr:bifunctional [glutamate--ammonia ligase]-adenylyl-L-tyrosine phosphorylase/[glutamate--ammonia-ligase] adenylyltransferase [Desulfobacterales bacterium]MDX2509338.1 bifunctional [glutamate--ammonia ligase]-adenylyl-L-tyrosine phosphorylase/[glutamate--ammonia-ligase] adenylyltransferase [Desulfobacterales bacterium]